MAHFYEERIYSLNPETQNVTYQPHGFIPGIVSREQIERDRKTQVLPLNFPEENILAAANQYLSINPSHNVSVWIERKSNQGNEELKGLFEEMGITKALSNHFHESSHRAHDGSCNPIKEHRLVNELYWNCGHLDQDSSAFFASREKR